MRKNQTSISAIGIAVLRTVESEKPAHERICFDPFANHFLPGWLYTLTRFLIRTGFSERRSHGEVFGFLIARERNIDDYLAECLKEGFEQLVILGAGYDSRPYRFEAIRKPMRVFEVDHPATQATKLDKVQKIFGSLPSHVTYVPIDFNQQTLGDCLETHGYDPQAKTVFIWQGVTYYLDPAAVDSTLAFIANHAAPGSSVIFDYMDETLLQGSTSHSEIKSMQRYHGMTGEDLCFGIPIAWITEFLIQRGFEQVHNVCSQDLKAMYFHGKNQSRKVASGYAIVSAVVAPQKRPLDFAGQKEKTL